MKINIDKNLVEFSPENQEETLKTEALWKMLVDCVRFNKKLVPVGQYVPSQDKFARFAIEGIDPESKDEIPEVFVEQNCTCYCQTCNKYIHLKKGDRVPPCCGKLMEIID